MRFLKNSLAVIILFFTGVSCDNRSAVGTEKKSESKKDTVAEQTQEPVTILIAGIPPAQLYDNAKTFIEKKYNVKFVYAGGCIVNERLSDSISEFNGANFYKLNKTFKKDMAEALYTDTESEFNRLSMIDSVIKHSAKFVSQPFFKHAYIYYVKNKNKYLAYFIISESAKAIYSHTSPDNYRLKLLAEVDSATININSIINKDSLINSDFSHLQYDKNY